MPPSFIRLVNGSIYNIRFEGVDAAGNSAPEVVIKNIVFDNEIPVLAVSKPTNNSFINSPQISFSISEDLVKSSLVLEHIAGTTDPSSPHVILLSEEKRKMGSFDESIFEAGMGGWCNLFHDIQGNRLCWKRSKADHCRKHNIRRYKSNSIY